MNFKGFKKVSSDKNSTTLMHPKGHAIMVVHSALSPMEKKQVESLPMHKMAQGGIASDQTQDYGQIPMKESKTGGKPQDVPFNSEVPAAQPRVDGQDNNYSGTVMMMANGGKVQRYAEGTPPGGVSADDDQMNYDGPNPYANAANVITSSVPQQASGKAPIPEATPPSNPNDPYGINNQYQNQILAAKQQQAAAMAQNAVNSSLGGANMATSQEAVAQQQANLAAQQDAQKKSNDEYAQIHQEVMNHQIDPDKYINNMTDGKKISTGIGLLLGGMGSGKTGQPNWAFNGLQDNIQRDIEAQKTNLGSMNNLLSANLNHEQNLNAAAALTNLQTQAIFAAKFNQNAQSATSQSEAANNLSAAALFTQKAGEAQQQYIRSKALTNSMQNPNTSGAQQIRTGQVMGYIPEAQANDLYKQLQTADAMGKSKDAAMSAFDQVDALQNVPNRVMNPIQSQSQIDALWNPSIAQLTKDSDGRITPTDLPMMNSMKPSILDDKETRQLKRSKLDQFVQQKMNFPMLDAYNVKSGAGNYAKQAPTKSSEKAPAASGVRYMGGKPYRLDPTGKFMIPVK